MAFAESANQALVRMAYRDESLALVEKHFISQNLDLSDNGGKVTQARAMALLGNGCGWWPQLTSQMRAGVEQVESSLFQDIQAFGLEIIFAARAEGGHLYIGPMLVAEGHPLAQAPEREVIVVETAGGEMVLTQPASETERVLRGVMGDVQRYLRNRSRKLMKAEFANAAAVSSRCMVICAYGQRETVIAQSDRVLMERIPGNGNWQAVITTKNFEALRATLAGVLLIPLAGEWQVPQQAGLRLVG
jgi:hypothetical protein